MSHIPTLTPDALAQLRASATEGIFQYDDLGQPVTVLVIGQPLREQLESQSVEWQTVLASGEASHNDEGELVTVAVAPESLIEQTLSRK